MSCRQEADWIETPGSRAVRIDVITLFPEFIQAAMAVGVVGRAQQRGLLDVQCWNPRDYATDNHRSVDGRVCGGGPGMVMTMDPLCAALDAVRTAAGPGRVVYPSPQGRRLTQGKVVEFAACEHLILLCGRYEGVDERLLASRIDEEVSIGDYVLSGGELAAAVIIDAVGRLQEGALNDAQSAQQDSFSDGLLDCPHYAKPVQHDLGSVPAVLLSGDHAAIGRWRRKQSLGRTWLRRPDLLARVELDAPSQKLLEEFRREVDAATRLSEAVKDRPDQSKTKANR